MSLVTKKNVAATIGAFAFALVSVVSPVGTANAQIQNGINAAQGDDVPTAGLFGDDSIFTTVVNLLLFFIGALSVIMLIWGGIRYATSAGNSSSVTAAKNTIMYAIIGLIVAFLAYALVNWVLGAITPGA